MPRLIFEIDKKYDLDLFLVVFKKDDPAGIASRAKEMDIPLALAKKNHS